MNFMAMINCRCKKQSLKFIAKKNKKIRQLLNKYFA